MKYSKMSHGKYIVTGLSLAAIMGVTALQPAVAGGTEAEQHMQKANELFMKRKLKEAAAEFREVIRLEPNDAKAHVRLASTLAAQEDYETAILECKQSIKLDPKFYFPHIILGQIYANPGVCDPPPPEPDGKCRIHANLLGVTARPEGKLEWADRDSPRRLDSYQAAIAEAGVLGGMVQINHPQWHWGLTADLLEALAARGVKLVEIANVQFSRWNAGDDRHPSMEALWDAALTAGATVWGVASDDAHDYDDDGGGSYPAGGGWVMVHARREPQAILDALAAGRFYSSTGVTLARAEVDGDALVVEVAADEPGDHRITFVGDGRVLGEVDGRSARWPLDHATSYVRAVVTRDDGARAWVQPVR